MRSTDSVETLRGSGRIYRDGALVLDGARYVVHLSTPHDVDVTPLALRLEGVMMSDVPFELLRQPIELELEDGRRFRAQELARLIKAGKVIVPGFHQVGESYIRANPDDVEANNLLKQFKQNLTSEVAVGSKR